MHRLTIIYIDIVIHKSIDVNVGSRPLKSGAVSTLRATCDWFVIAGALWVCIVLNPHCSPAEKQQWRRLLEKWTQIDICPQEDPDYRQQPAATRHEAVSCLP